MDRKSEKLIIRVFGVVQGVGFRPFVARLAMRHQVMGHVKNCGGYAEILAVSQDGSLRPFLRDLLSFHGVIRTETEPWCGKMPNDFKIIESTSGKALAVMLPPDLPVCKRCLTELRNPHNRRYRHAFISCVDCGVRYSVIKDIPYDRATTSMDAFPLCDTCQTEYEAMEDRRHFAQTICCLDCGPELIYGKSHGEAALAAAIAQLQSGGVIAIKGVGGYHLACLADCEAALKRLRAIKQREDKPFAVMFRDIHSLQKHCFLSKDEQALICSDARPIVLLKRKKSDIHPLVYRESLELGAFLPYTAYQHLILDCVEKLVLTSANLTEEAMIYEDEEALKIPCDGILHHTRKIETPLDDSVAAIAGHRPMIFRRARGYVPTPVYLQGNHGQVLAAGSDLKASFALQNGEYCYPSQYLGDLAQVENFSRWKSELERMKRIFDVTPERAVCDLHPGYFSSRACDFMDVPVTRIQHHFAHTLSVMAEHKLNEVIGICFDGTGYGTDGSIWGGEFLLCNRTDFTRVGHLESFPIIGGDSAARDAAKCALCAAHAFSAEPTFEDARAPVIRAALEHQVNTIDTTSVGRLFDAVSAALGLCMENHYEGACGEAVERAAQRAKRAYKTEMPIVEQSGGFYIDQKKLWKDLCSGDDSMSLARGFVEALARAVCDGAVWMRRQSGLQDVALSGGVFQNRLLLSLATEMLKTAGFRVYRNEVLPVNDGAIALGQLYYVP